MEDFDEALYHVWQANLNVLTGSPGGASRLARMMTFSPSHMKLIVAGRRDFSEEFVRGVETVTGLPPHWMDERRGRADIPAEAQRALDEESPVAVFRGTAHPAPKRPVCAARSRFYRRRKPPAASPTRRCSRRSRIGGIWCSGATATCCCRTCGGWKRQLALLQLDGMSPKAEELLASDKLGDAAKADLSGRLEQIDKHKKLLLQHVEELAALLASTDEN